MVDLDYQYTMCAHILHTTLPKIDSLLVYRVGRQHSITALLGQWFMQVPVFLDLSPTSYTCKLNSPPPPSHQPSPPPPLLCHGAAARQISPLRLLLIWEWVELSWNPCKRYRPGPMVSFVMKLEYVSSLCWYEMKKTMSWLKLYCPLHQPSLVVVSLGSYLSGEYN